MSDLVCIGALNLDLIATKTRLAGVDPHAIAELGRKFEYGAERPVSEDEIHRTLTQMGAQNFEACLGGSAFNTLHAFACLNSGLELGFVGVAGATKTQGVDFLRKMRQLNIDTSCTLSSPERSGVCISYIHEGERSLLTWPGANTLAADHFQANRAAIVDQLCQAKVLHVTSFFDASTPRVLVDIIAEAKRRNPWLKLSFDPGHHWVEHDAEEVRRLFKLSDLLFLNAREFELLGHHRPGTRDEDLARTIFGHCASTTVLIILKRYDIIKVFFMLQGRLLVIEQNNLVLPPPLIEDATGAGDVFAAGFLAATMIPGLSLREGIALGLKLVHAKLRTAGSSGFPKFGAIFEDFVAGAACGAPPSQEHPYERSPGHDRATPIGTTTSPHGGVHPVAESECDVIVVCALPKPELDKVMHTGTEWTALPSSPRDPHVYYRSTYTTALGKTLRVIAAAPNHMGLPASAVLATKMILRFQPKLVTLVGIAAGIRHDTQGFGDILAGDQTFDSGAGKLVTDGGGRLTLRPSTDPLPIHPRLLARLRERARTEKGLNDIQRSWQAAQPRTALKLHVGPIASGAAVVATPGPVEEVLSHWRKLVGFEMEAYAVHRACSDALDPPRPFLCLKSICDFANDGKNDDWQDYAAFTAAQFCHRFIVEEWENLELD